MEIPRKHDKKKNLKTLSPAINVGAAGGLGLGGVVLLGGALITATVFSALAFRSSRRSQRRSSSENTKKKMPQSTSTETQSVDAPKNMELTPSEEVTSMMETEIIQSLTQDEQVHSGDGNADTIDSVVSEDRENRSHHEDSAFESEEQVDASSLVSDEGVMLIEEYEAIEVPLKDIVEEASLKEDEEDSEDHQETVNQVKVEDDVQVRFLEEKENGHDEIVLENCEGESSDETGYADQSVHDLEEEEKKEAIDAVQNCAPVQLLDGQDETILKNCEGDLSNKKGPANQNIREGDQEMKCSRKQVTFDHEVAPDAQEMLVNGNHEAFVVACVMNTLKEAVDDQTTHKVDEQVTAEDEAPKVDDHIPHVDFVKADENSEETVMVNAELSYGVSPSTQEEPTPEAKISSNKIKEADEQVEVETITEHELVKKDEIPHVESVIEVEDSKEDVTVKDELSSGVGSTSVHEEPTPETKTSNHNVEEDMDENQIGKKYNAGAEDVTVKAELNSGAGSPSVQVEPPPEEKISNHRIEENNENQKIINKNHNDSEEDVTVKAEISSGVSSTFVQDKLTPEVKISNHKTEEKMDENQIILAKKHNDVDNNRVIKKQAFASASWNLKLMVWSVLVSVWCLCHWYSELPFPELSLVGSLLFILILFGYRNRTTHLVKYE